MEKKTKWGKATAPAPVAFPGALGYGNVSVGGRGGEVVYVTRLDDDWDPGSLRHALYIMSGPRTVVFNVSGYIDLSLPVGAASKDIAIVNPYVTIAGQSAPGEGICIRNGGIAIQTHDVTIRHLRVRPGDGAGTDPEDRDAIKFQGAYNCIIDHCSLSWSIDENVSTWVNNGVFPHDITIQNCIISEGLYTSSHPSGNHSRGLLIGDGTSNVMVIHNLLMSNNRRNPMIKGATSNISIVNNIMYNWGAIGNSPAGVAVNFSDIEGSGPTGASLVNNAFVKGPNGGTDTLSFDTVDSGSQIFLTGNYGDIDDAAEIAGQSFLYPAPQFSDADFVWTTSEILNDVGAKVPARDAVDIRLLTETGSNGGALINSPTDVGGYPSLASGTPYTDVDGDGIDDDWEVAYGLNPAVANNNGDISQDGYTNIEHFLNELADG